MASRPSYPSPPPPSRSALQRAPPRRLVCGLDWRKDPVGRHCAGSPSAVIHEHVLGLQVQVKEMVVHPDGLEKEHDLVLYQGSLSLPP